MAKKMKTIKPATTAPTKLKIIRSGRDFTATWAIGDNNYADGQNFQYSINGGAWTSLDVTPTQTSIKFISNLNYAAYYPYTGTKLTQISIRVRGKRAPWSNAKSYKTYIPKMSEWSVYTYAFYAPKAPTVSMARSEDSDLSCVFSWSAENPTNTGYAFTLVQWTHCLLMNSCQANGAYAWNERHIGSDSSGVGGAVGSTPTISESLTPQVNAAYTRWFACRSRGPAGDSAWVYFPCLYSLPFIANVKSAIYSNDNAGGHNCVVTWDSPTNVAHPITITQVRYAFAVPETGMVCPDGASWQEASRVKDLWGDNTAPITLPYGVPDNNCLFIQVSNTYERWTTWGTPIIATNGYGALTDPEDLMVISDSDNFTATVTADNTADAVADSYLVVRYFTRTDPNGIDIGIINHNESSAIVQCPEWDPADPPKFGVYAAVGPKTATERADGVTVYSVRPLMKSGTITKGGSIPAAPGNVTLTRTDIPGTIHVVWSWTWAEATVAEISWANHSDAWVSTDEPDTYEITSMRASAWNISGLDTGVTWWVRIRLGQVNGDETTWGAYSTMQSINLASAPIVPELTLSKPIVTEDDTLTASWAFVSTDGTPQASAELAEVITEGGTTTYNTIAYASTAQFVELDVARLEWASGESHTLAVKVASASGLTSEGWSNQVSVSVADPLAIEITQTSLVEETITEAGVSRVVQSLKSLPLTLTVTGSGDKGTTTVIVERRKQFDVLRPDESRLIGYEGETVIAYTQTGEDAITINREDLIGYLDDGGAYQLIATISDELGQSAEQTIDFEVHWTSRAIKPSATVEIDETNAIAILEPVAPDGVEATSRCDIYRLSVDKPELIYPDASWGIEYVDPYPTIGEYGGYRFVYKTADGCYTTADGMAWYNTNDDDDVDIIFEHDSNIIDFGLDSVELQYNVDLSNSWSKDFKETHYLGGSVQGDWNQAVGRSSDMSSVVLVSDDEGTIEAMRRLAEHTGICHVRTKDGSSYAADVQVSEDYSLSDAHKFAKFGLKITRVDPEGYDGMLYEDWLRLNEEA